MGKMRLQSVLEYLMTYGWAIFIIAAVMAVLFYMLFSGSASSLISPKASPGSCFVHIAYVNGNLGFSRSVRNLEGQCNNEIPEYTAKFNGVNSIVRIYGKSVLNYMPITYSMWIKPRNCETKPGQPPYCFDYIFDYYYPSDYLYTSYLSTMMTTSTQYNGLVTSAISSAISTPDNSLTVSLISPSYPSSEFLGKWYYLAATYNGNTFTLYLNGASVATSNLPMSYSGVNHNLFLGAESVPNSLISYDSFNGSIANVQFYNVSLSPSAIRQLYSEGIGGAPIDLNNLAGWWPLNGNANDYSGIESQGTAYNVNFTTLWESGYSQPQNFTS